MKQIVIIVLFSISCIISACSTGVVLLGQAVATVALNSNDSDRKVTAELSVISTYEINNYLIVYRNGIYKDRPCYFFNAYDKADKSKLKKRIGYDKFDDKDEMEMKKFKNMDETEKKLFIKNAFLKFGFDIGSIDKKTTEIENTSTIPIITKEVPTKEIHQIENPSTSFSGPKI